MPSIVINERLQTTNGRDHRDYARKIDVKYARL